VVDGWLAATCDLRRTRYWLRNLTPIVLGPGCGPCSVSGDDCYPGNGSARSALSIYSWSMATIQIRDISDEAYTVIRQRARSAGQSIQVYMKGVIEQLSREQTDGELFDEMERLVAEGGVELDPDVVLSSLRADRR
jgi:antitoxin FitA